MLLVIIYMKCYNTTVVVFRVVFNLSFGKARKILMKKSCKKIFISHSSKNEDFGNILLEYLRRLGIDTDIIFYSSNYHTGADYIIPDEVLSALKSSVLDIIILSNDYSNSKYCLNESGIIWSKTNKQKIIIILPDATDDDYAGFIDKMYIHFSFIDKKSFNGLVNKINDLLIKCNLTSENPSLSYDANIFFSNQINNYIKKLPILDNLSVPSIKSHRNKSIIKEISDVMRDINTLMNEQDKKSLVFYKDYSRDIIIKASDTNDKIQVITTTKCTLVNLSNDSYFDSFCPQFLKNDGGLNSLKYTHYSVDGEDRLNSIKNYNIVSPNCDDRLYVCPEEHRIEIEPHTCRYIKYTSSYEISPNIFFQSKTISVPCGDYKLQAEIDPSFTKKFGDDYFLRYQIIPPRPSDYDQRIMNNQDKQESQDKKIIGYHCSKGFPSGGGYVLVLCQGKLT